jgi:hypothetical protein
MISIIQILLILFALFAWSRAALRLKDKIITVGEFLFWSLIWASVIIVSLIPQVMSIISDFIGIGRATDLAVYVSIVVLFYLMFRIYVKIESQNHQMTKLIREIAIENAKKKKK